MDFFVLMCSSPLLWLANTPCLAAQLKVSPLALMLSLYLNIRLTYFISPLRIFYSFKLLCTLKRTFL